MLDRTLFWKAFSPSSTNEDIIVVLSFFGDDLASLIVISSPNSISRIELENVSVVVLIIILLYQPYSI